MGERHYLTFMTQKDKSENLEKKIIGLIDKAYMEGKDITQPEIEKTLRISHTTASRKLKKLQNERKIRCWLQNGVNHFDFPPIIPGPYKIATILTAVLLGIVAIFHVMIQITIYPPLYLFESFQNKNIMNNYSIFTVAFFMVLLNFIWATIWTLKTKKDINNHVGQLTKPR